MTRFHTFCWLLILLLTGGHSSAQSQINAVLSIRVSAAPPSGPALRISQPGGRFGPGKTSIRFKANKQLKREGQARQVGYYERDRDLGQTFTIEGAGFVLGVITVQVTDSVFAGAAGAPMLVQLFEVLGEPVVNNNGTDTGQVVHWTKDAWADDYITGETFRSLAVVGGANLPAQIPGRSYLRLDVS